MFTRKLLVTAVITTAVLCLTFAMPAPQIQAASGQQIIFAAPSGAKFNSLTIKGDSSRRANDTWTINGPRQIAITTGVWWGSWVEVYFPGLGRGYCQMDDLTGSSDYALVTYNGSSVCSGGSGSAGDPLKNTAQAWINQLFWRDRVWGNTFVGRLDSARSAVGCMAALAGGRPNGDCIGVADDVLSSALQKTR